MQQFETNKQQSLPVHVTTLLHTFIALLRGSRDPALANDPELNYIDAVELKRLFFDGAGL